MINTDDLGDHSSLFRSATAGLPVLSLWRPHLATWAAVVSITRSN